MKTAGVPLAHRLLRKRTLTAIIRQAIARAVIKQEGQGSTSQMHWHARTHKWFSCVRWQIEFQVPRVKRFMRSHSPRSTILCSSIWVTSFLPSRTAWRPRETRSALPPRMLPGRVGLSMASMAECLVAGEVRATPPEGRSTTLRTCICVPTERNFGKEMTRSVQSSRASQRWAWVQPCIMLDGKTHRNHDGLPDIS